jgi:hypothetical protein
MHALGTNFINALLMVVISNFALTKSHIILRVSYFQLLPIQITPKFDVFSLTFALRLYLCSDTYGIGKNKGRFPLRPYRTVTYR